MKKILILIINIVLHSNSWSQPSCENNSPLSIIPNSSFEDLGDCCPNGYSDLNCAASWIQASNPTTDLHHQCNFFSSIIQEPIPDGQAVVGAIMVNGWKEYLGTCLSSPIFPNQDYRLTMGVNSVMTNNNLTAAAPNSLGVMPIVIYGSSNCNDLPFNGNDCPLNGNDGNWQIIGSANYNPNFGNWETLEFNINVNSQINVIAIGAPCNLPANYATMTVFSNMFPYFFFDNLILTQEFQITGDINSSTTGEPCNGTLEVTINDEMPNNGDFSWYLNGEIIPGENEDEFQAPAGFLSDGDLLVGHYMNDTGWCANSEVEIVSLGQPLAQFDSDSNCLNDITTFNNLSTVPVGSLSYHWDLGDASGTSTDANPEYLYELSGSYDVKLIAVSDFGCSDTINQEQIVFALPSVEQESFPSCLNTLQLHQNASFADGQEILSTTWDFGDSTPLIDSIDSYHMYSDTGNFLIQMTVTTNQGCINDSIFDVYVHPLPFVDFLVSPTCEGETVQIQNLSDTTNFEIVEYKTDFHDGAISFEDEATHIFNGYGTFEITLSIEDFYGCKNSVTKPVEVERIEALFSIYDSTGCPELEVEFTDESWLSSSSEIITREWNINDSIALSEAQLSNYSFGNISTSNIRNYDVSLTVTSLNDCSAVYSIEDAITVFPSPIANFEYSPSEDVYALDYINFTNFSEGENSVYWTFGDGQYSTDSSPVSQYIDFGVYEVNLLVENTYDCFSTVQSLIEINPLNHIYFPNSFTPNNDGINDVLYAQKFGNELLEFSIQIFSRWGDLVFSSNSIEQVWNGTNSGDSNYLVPDGVYSYTLFAKFIEDPVPFYSTGSITVLR